MSVNQAYALKAYVGERNFMAELFKKPAIDLTKKADLLSLLEQIECDLSPENLTCDGELSRSAVNAKYRRLMGAQAEVKKLLGVV